ncbi:MAG: CRISPR system precrRNA processing endoribonuclease RAMP protein Cas6 [Dissulfuribacterales bacterium]
MLFGQYDFTCQLETDAQLPYYKGSTFRGVFGRALKKVVCALKRQECETCLLNSKCVYALVFETPIAGKSKDARMAATPHPFVIEPPLTIKTHYPAGSAFDFSLLLMGDANNYLPYFIYAFEQMGKIGIGKKINGRRGRFVLENVRINDDVIYSSADQKLNMNGNVKKLGLESPKILSDKNLRLTLTLETPLRLKFGNKLQAAMPFHVLVRAMLRRVSSLMNAYGDGEPDLDYKGLVQRAETVKIAENNLSWFDWQRYSFRQDQKMLMGGMAGSVTYEGSINEYLPLLKFCEKVHLGKQTAFGLGKLQFETRQSRARVSKWSVELFHEKYPAGRHGIESPGDHGNHLRAASKQPER